MLSMIVIDDLIQRLNFNTTTFRTRTLMMEGVTRLQTSTPNNDDTNSTSDRRTVRSRPVSYAEFPDFDTSG